MPKKIENKTKVKKTEVKDTTKEVKKNNLLFAVVEISGNQYLVEENKTYTVKKVDSKKGDKYISDKVLMVVDGDKVKVGKPYLTSSKVEFEIASQFKGEKIDTFKYTAKSRVRKHSGSRSLLTKLLVKKITVKE